MKNEYLANPHTISALERIVKSKDRPLTLIGQFPKEEMEEVHLMLRHGLLGGQIIQAPPNHTHYLLRVDRINEAGTQLLIEANPQLQNEIAALSDAQLEAEAAGRRGDPRCELARQELERRAAEKQPKPTKAEVSQRATPRQNQSPDDEERRHAASLEAGRLSQSAHRLARKAIGASNWSAWASVISIILSLGALWLAWSGSQKPRQDSREAALEQRIRALEQRGNAPTSPFMVLPSQTPAPTTSPGSWTLPAGGGTLNSNPVPSTPWLIPPRP